MKNLTIREKRHRLPGSFYIGQVRITFTLCIEDKKDFFIKESIVKEFVKAMKEAAIKHDCRNWVYIFMPDHLHLIIEGNSEKADLWKMIVLFKQKTGYWLARNARGIRWQKDFYDHIHRKDEDLKKYIKYILENPVRKNLVNRWQDYSFKGSLDFDVNDII